MADKMVPCRTMKQVKARRSEMEREQWWADNAKRFFTTPEEMRSTTVGRVVLPYRKDS